MKRTPRALDRPCRPASMPPRAGAHPVLKILVRLGIACVAGALFGHAYARTTLTIGIGTQDTTTNTVTGGAIIREMKLLEQYLPHDGKYKDVDYRIDWENFTSGPPVTNAMMAGKLQIGMMGDYPLLVNGATGQKLAGNATELIAVLGYNAYGAGNGVVVNKDSTYYSLADLKGKLVSVPFGSAAHGMLLRAMQANGWSSDYWQLANQSPEVGTTNLQQKKIDAHADFVPFPELLAYRGFARKVFDGAQTRSPTFHGVVVRKDFAQAYPEVVVAYLRALLAANAWVREHPQLAAQKIQDWTHVEKEVAYVYLGPDGIHTLDPTIKPIEMKALDAAYGVLKGMGRVANFNAQAWVNDSYLRTAFKQAGLDYDAQRARTDNYHMSGTDLECKKPVDDPSHAAQVWIAGGDIVTYSSTQCALRAMTRFESQGKKVDVAYVMDHSLGIKMFATQAFFVETPGVAPSITPFLLKADAQQFASTSKGTLMSYDEILKTVIAGR
jgi:NitT/TauT family transport system substrate-binding protein